MFYLARFSQSNFRAARKTCESFLATPCSVACVWRAARAARGEARDVTEEFGIWSSRTAARRSRWRYDGDAMPRLRRQCNVSAPRRLLAATAVMAEGKGAGAEEKREIPTVSVSVRIPSYCAENVCVY